MSGRLSLVVVLLLSATPGLRADDYSRRIWRTEDGLPQNRIQAITQTADGYLWIGTFEGLARFDGARFVVFDRSNTPAFSDNSILSLEPGADGSLWIGAEGGGLLHYARGEFQVFGSREGLTNAFVRALLLSRDGTLWVGTDRGFFRRKKDGFARLDNTAEIPLASVKSIAEDASGKIWVAAAAGLLTVTGGGLVRVDCSARAPETTVLLLREGLIHDGCQPPPVPLPTSGISSLRKDASGVLWIGTAGQGLLRTGPHATVSYSAPAMLPDNSVSVIFEDRQHDIWAGMQDGLVRFSRTAFTTVTARDGLLDDSISTVYEDPERVLWLFTSSGQIYRMNGSKPERVQFPGIARNFPAHNMLRDSAGVLWIGAGGGGLVRIAHGSAVHYARKDGLRSNTVRQIHEGPDGAIWIATDSGLSRWNGHGFTNYYLEDGLSYPSLRCLATDSNGDILVGTDAGLNRIHHGRFVTDPAFAPLRQEKIWSIHVDGDGLWLGTRGGGLALLRHGRLTRFTMRDGLVSDSIYQILDDGRGRFWMSGPSGISSVSREELDRFTEHETAVIHAVAYGKADGMESSQMYAGVRPEGCRRASGELWFPSVKGAVRIEPDRIPERAPAPVLIDRILVGDSVLRIPSDGAEVVVPPGRGRVEIDFTAPDLIGSQRVGFSYKLEGFDEGWIPVTRARTAYYSNLPPRHYRFRVIATDAAAPAASSEASVSLYWKPAFHQTLWFYAICAAIALALASSGMWLYTRQTRSTFALRLAERTRVAREMHDTVIQGCVGISTLLEAAARTRRFDAEEAAQLLDAARAQAKSTLEEARQAVWDLRHYEDGVSAIERLVDLAHKLGAEHGIRVEAALAGDPPLVDPAIDRALLLAGREALRNAVRHALPVSIRLSAWSENRRLTLEVVDDGAGFDPAAIQSDDGHFGIEGMRERIEQAGGVFAIQSRRGVGTTVRMTVPLGSRPGSGNALNAQSHFNDAAVQRGDGSLSPVRHVEAAEDQVDVPFHGRFGDA
jgi:signal transduction histidine kinase/ligand-binding sensor domain-containing protein